MTPQPLVTVIMPAYNSSRFIAESIDSVLKQTYSNFELLVVDDGSTDNTVSIVNKISLKDIRVKIFPITHSGRPSVPRNFGIQKSSGEFTAFIDSDDLWVPDKLESQLTFIGTKVKPVFIYSMSVTFGDVNIFSPFYEVLPLPYKAAKNKEDLLMTGNTIPLSSVLADTETLKMINGFDEDPELKVEDYDLWIRMSDIGPFYFLPELQVYYRIHSSQFSADWKTRQERLDYLSKKLGIKIPEIKQYRRKGIFLVIRNILHFTVYLIMRIKNLFG